MSTDQTSRILAIAIAVLRSSSQTKRYHAVTIDTVGKKRLVTSEEEGDDIEKVLSTLKRLGIGQPRRYTFCIGSEDELRNALLCCFGLDQWIFTCPDRIIRKLIEIDGRCPDLSSSRSRWSVQRSTLQFEHLLPALLDPVLRRFGVLLCGLVGKRWASYYLQKKPEAEWHCRSRALGEGAFRGWVAGDAPHNSGDLNRMFLLAMNLRAIERRGISGAMAEVGVYKGNSARVLREVAPDRDLYLFDTFCGARNEAQAGPPVKVLFSDTSVDGVRALVGIDVKTHYCVGSFPSTLAMIEPTTEFALVHLDCDDYHTTLAACEFFYPRLPKGGMTIVHDYENGAWPGVSRAIDEYLNGRNYGFALAGDRSGTVMITKND
jgi:hypothetical protein